MNIKSLLIGSAAAIVAVSGARAADAVVVAEPEPMEYVRVCDVYGAGFYYIPGTETCLRVGGYIQYDIRAGDSVYGGVNDVDDKQDLLADGVEDFNDTYYKRTRVSVQLDARSETELGTLRGYTELRFNYETDVGAFGESTMDTNFAINHGYIELGGFRLGRTDSLFTTMTNYAGDILADDIVPYGPFDTNQIAYTFTGGNGFSAAVALEQGDGDILIDTDADGIRDSVFDAYTIDSYVPHVVAGIAYTQAWGGISAVAGYDSNWEEWAGKVRLDVNATEAISLWAMAGYKSGADDGDVFGPGTDNPNFYGQWGGDWAVWGGAAFQINEKAKFNAQLSYDEAENFAAVANVVYEVVPGFAVTPEVNYQDNFDEDDADGVGGWLRFRRSF